ncbi:hypothetical protein LPN01_07840 [Sphingomonas sp. A2-49]|uniref:hypothetical protein n=1 Tax=Sphingomonas sp. A2-49 TaxID=1391375 RepID=UPI0021D33E0B|nr:hypothetical protein [Sphingomonas sp. A2-49]MCU6453985.1 hypothetical protein [Sphingomonas sp. A2-49]
MANFIEYWTIQVVAITYLAILGWGCAVVQHDIRARVLLTPIVVAGPMMYGLWYYPVVGLFIGSGVPLVFMSLLAIRNLYFYRDRPLV